MIGVKHHAETAGVHCLRTVYAVGERSHRDEGQGVTHSGVMRSKNVGTSNHNADEKSARRKIKVSFAMDFSEGLVGPRSMAKAGHDGHTVNIP